MARKDILLDKEGDLLIRNGDIVIGDSDKQHIQDIVQSFKGEWMEFPLVGAEAIKYLNGKNIAELTKESSRQLASDGYFDIFIENLNGKILINAKS